ncbi:hypothetical protein ACH4PU_30485 [Streptomyces sp. NPDC021100]|uniref:hypothetical protein n=1 Tax=Streptomyces sp. NPDC021100 TaxID=3365114 RepID=UPI0037BC44A8
MTAVLDDADGDLIGRCYTKARRTPVVVGTVPGGMGRSFRLPFGPYTLTQLGALVAGVVALVLTRPLWGGHGLVDLVVLVTVPFGLAFALRRLHVDGRNPAAAAASVVMMLAGPRWGRLHGRPWRPVSPRSTGVVVTLGEPTARTPAPQAAVPPPADDAAPAAQPRRAPARPAPAVPQPTRPEPRSGVPVASGVQALLARRAPSRSAQES